MNLTLLILALVLGLFLSAVFSGSETGLYSLSRSRLDLEVSRGTRGAHLMRRLAERRGTMLITILIGNNVALEVLTLVAEHAFEVGNVASWKRHVILTLVLTPIVFLFGELLPKDLFRRRPHVLVRLSIPMLMTARVLFYPLERVLTLLTWTLEKALGFESEVLVGGAGRAEVHRVLAEGRAAGVLEPHAEELARNALKLCTLPVTRAMLPWKDIVTLDLNASEDDLRQQVEASKHTRLPIMDGGRAVGYVHQLVVLRAGRAQPVFEGQRDLTFVEPGLSVERALAHLRVTGRRMAVVGTSDAPLGLVTLKDLVEEISGDLGGW